MNRVERAGCCTEADDGDRKGGYYHHSAKEHGECFFHRWQGVRVPRWFIPLYRCTGRRFTSRHCQKTGTGLRSSPPRKIVCVRTIACVENTRPTSSLLAMTRRSRLSGGIRLPLAMLSMVGGLGRTRAFHLSTTTAAAATAAGRRCRTGSSLTWVRDSHGGQAARLAATRNSARALGTGNRIREHGGNGKLNMVKVRGGRVDTRPWLTLRGVGRGSQTKAPFASGLKYKRRQEIGCSSAGF